MEVDKFIGAIVGVVVILILVVAVVIPIISSATATGGALAGEDWKNVKDLVLIVPMLMIVGVVIFVINSFVQTRKGKN